MDAIQAYRESEITADNPVRLVVLLYDQLLRDIRRALDAFEHHDIRSRCEELDHALIVLAQLQGSLNLESGQEPAETLDRFYDLVRENIVRATIEASPDPLEKQWRNILSVREAWLEVERQQTAPVQSQPSSDARPDRNSGNMRGKSEWKV